MRYLVKRPLPKGQLPGEYVDLHPDVGAVFMLVDAVEPAELAPDPPEAPKAKPQKKNSYRRQDLQAETVSTE